MDMLQILRNIIRQGIPCLFHLLTGLYCPGCGGTRAVWYLLHGQILKSLQYHPLVLYGALIVAAELAAYWIAGRRGRVRDVSASFRRYEWEVLIGTVILVLNWILKNYMLVFRGVDLLAERPF